MPLEFALYTDLLALTAKVVGNMEYGVSKRYILLLTTLSIVGSIVLARSMTELSTLRGICVSEPRLFWRPNHPGALFSYDSL